LSLTDLAFTGTRDGLTPWQILMLAGQLRRYWKLGYRRLHQGDAIGADAVAAGLAADLGYTVIAHPADRDDQRAHWPHADETRPVAPPLYRNEIMVHESSAGLVAPNSSTPEARSGTWMTARRMKTKGIGYTVISPDRLWVVEPTLVAVAA
jgi:hypothetical protein